MSGRRHRTTQTCILMPSENMFSVCCWSCGFWFFYFLSCTIRSVCCLSLFFFFFVVVCILLLVVLSLFANIIFGMYVCVVMWHLNNSARACIDDRFVSTTIWWLICIHFVGTTSAKCQRSSSDDDQTTTFAQCWLDLFDRYNRYTCDLSAYSWPIMQCTAARLHVQSKKCNFCSVLVLWCRKMIRNTDCI